MDKCYLCKKIIKKNQNPLNIEIKGKDLICHYNCWNGNPQLNDFTKENIKTSGVKK